MPPMEAWFDSVLHWLSLPQFGLSTLFFVALVSATLLPLGSEPALIGLVKLDPNIFWAAVFVATAGNTIGGAISYATGFYAERAYEKVSHHAAQDATSRRATAWLSRWGPPACLLSWLPVIGDPLCAVAGWLRLAFWPCVGYMAIGKFARYVTMTAAVMWAMPHWFH
jgi:membrane protein YqaA with SNARE-associated domain